MTASSIPEPSPSPDGVRAQLDRILDSDGFDASDRSRRFLRYVVEETLAGRAEQIKAYCIAVSVFRRDANFDPQSDPIVRLEAGRLRRSLDYYYLTVGKDDPVRIAVPKGGYVPQFTTGPEREKDSIVASSCDRKRRGMAAATCLGGLLAGILAVGLWLEGGGVGTGHPQGPDFAPVGGISVVVAPFAYRGVETDRFGTAGVLTDHVIRHLSRLPELTVSTLSATSGTGPHVRVDGSVQVEDRNLRVNVHLTAMPQGVVLRAQHFSRRLQKGGVLGVEQAIGAEIASYIADPRDMIYRQAGAHVRTLSPQAIGPADCALRYALYSVDREVDERAAVRSCLERTAAATDRTPFWAALSQVYADDHRSGPRDGPAATVGLERALEAALRAVERDPQDARGRRALYAAYCLGGLNDLCLNAAVGALWTASTAPQALTESTAWDAESSDAQPGIGRIQRALGRGAAWALLQNLQKAQ